MACLVLGRHVVLNVIDARTVLVGDRSEEALRALSMQAAEAAGAGMAFVAIEAGPCLILRAHLGMPDALALSGGAALADWPLRFGSVFDPAIRLRGATQRVKPGAAAAMFGSFSALALPVPSGDTVLGAFAVADPRPRNFSRGAEARLRELRDELSSLVRQQVRELRARDQFDEEASSDALFDRVREAARQARQSYGQLQTAAVLGRWYAEGRVARSPEFSRNVDEALISAAELSRSVSDLVRLARRIDRGILLESRLGAALTQAALVFPAFQPLLRVERAASSSLRTPALWRSALAALPSSGQLEHWGARCLQALVGASEAAAKVRTSRASSG